jgi:phosphomannomutase
LTAPKKLGENSAFNCALTRFFNEDSIGSVNIQEKIFKAYDIRGIYPDEINEAAAYAIGLAVVNILHARNAVVGRDMRLSSDKLAKAVISGLSDGGAQVTDIGLISTDGLYFAVGKYDYECGIMITASHNPPKYNGMKVCEKNAIPLSGDGKLSEVLKNIKDDNFIRSETKGQVTSKNILQDYVKHVLSFIDIARVKPFKIVVDAGNGMAGAIMPEISRHLPCEIVPLYFELDGSFPNHPASPIEPENVADLKKKIRETGADLGAAFDGDADRVFLIDEKCQTLGGDMVTALVAKALLKKNPGSTILYNLICSKAVPELVESLGGRAIRTRVGHALIKPLMREYNAIFGGEHSGHFYFRDNWFADSGLIALLVCLELISDADMPLSAQVAEFDHYVRSGEINSQVSDIKASLAKIENSFRDGRIDKIDGLTIDFGNCWFNVRPSNTEPLLRLNVEADNRELLEKMTFKVLEIIRSK